MFKSQMTISILMPTDEGEKKIWLDNMVVRVLCKLDPDVKGQILFIKPGWKDGNNIPMVEVLCYAEKKMNKADLGKLFVANCVTLATRVRTDILRAIATKNSNKGVLELCLGPSSPHESIGQLC